MAKKNPKPAQLKINLVPKDPFFQSPLGKILKWALSVGRYIVIFTELIVIISFLTRFSLDRQVTDLNEDIFQKKTVIESYGDLEANVRILQKKINEYKQVEQQENLAEYFPKLQAVTPGGITYDELQIGQEAIIIRGTANSQNAFTLFANNLELSPDLGQINIEQISAEANKKSSSFFEFSIIIEKPKLATDNKKT